VVNNSGVIISGNDNSSFGPISVTHQGPAAGRNPAAGAGEGHTADVGIITVLPVETTAVIDMLQAGTGYRSWRQPDRTTVHEARLPTAGSWARVAAIQTLEPGQRSATLTYQQLRRACSPTVVMLVGVAGGIDDEVRLGDVVIASSVIYYDSRREAADGTHRRISTGTVPAVMGRLVNDFLSRHGEPVRVDAARSPSGRPFAVRYGPIGSGEAVVTDRYSRIRVDLDMVNEKALAVETEAGGVVQAHREEYRDDAHEGGWLVVKGISDAADKAKDDNYKWYASQHAAWTSARLIGSM
jgi:adenosylhomocysteine nucleosidase